MHRAFLKQIQTLVTTAFGLIAALAWNTAITTLVHTYLPTGSGLAMLFLYALLVTALAVFVGIALARASARLGLDDQDGK
jgi:cation transporter-like permease